MCFPTRSFSEQHGQALLRAEATESHVAPATVIERQIARQPAVALVGGLEGHRIGPLAQECLDEPLSLAVGPGCVGLGAARLEIHCTAGFSPFTRAIGGAVVGEDTTAGDPLLAEPAHSPRQEADRGGLLLVGQHLHVSQASGVIHRHVDLLVAGASRTALTAVAGDAVADPLEPGELFGVDMDHVARLLPLVSLHRRLGVEVPQLSKAQSLHRPRDGRQRSSHSVGNPPEGAALVPEVHGVLQLLRIERPPLGAANTPSIRQGGVTAAAVTSEPLVGGAQADASFCGKGLEGQMVDEVSTDQAFPTERRQTGHGMAMHGV